MVTVTAVPYPVARECIFVDYRTRLKTLDLTHRTLDPAGCSLHTTQ